MAYLDLNPMITALRTRPDEFEMIRGRLNHIPSRHSFGFDPHGNATVHAQCNCAWLSVTREQSREMAVALDTWKDTYWRAVEINREFASHFKRPNVLVRMWRAIANVLAERDATPLPVAQTAPVPIKQPVRTAAPEREMALG
jgi:hypothetical protein